MKKFLTFGFFYFLAIIITWVILINQIRWETKLTFGDPITALSSTSNHLPTTVSYQVFKNKYGDQIPEIEPADAVYETNIDLSGFLMFGSGCTWAISLVFGALYKKFTGAHTRFSRRVFAIGLFGKIGFWIGVVFAFQSISLYPTAIGCALGMLVAVPIEMLYQKINYGHIAKK